MLSRLSERLQISLTTKAENEVWEENEVEVSAATALRTSLIGNGFEVLASFWPIVNPLSDLECNDEVMGCIRINFSVCSIYSSGYQLNSAYDEGRAGTALKVQGLLTYVYQSS
ncbi:unnamed protein product [Toxocara canis]|uniref:Phage protein n=1 Tax=Toxocara canis TaxID=6265 RepID=A0A183UUR0_TOXCA|nr:unnamed protein product [Toxocara canis]